MKSGERGWHPGKCCHPCRGDNVFSQNPVVSLVPRSTIGYRLKSLRDNSEIPKLPDNSEVTKLQAQAGSLCYFGARLGLLLILLIAFACLAAPRQARTQGTDSDGAQPDPTANRLEALLRRTPTRPGKFPAIRPVKLLYRFGWSGITAARGSVEFSRPRPGISKADMEAHISGVARRLWRMDTRVLEWCDAATLHPVRVRQAEWYRNDTSLAAQEFTRQDVLRAKGGTKGGDPDPAFFADAPADEARLKEITHAKAKRVTISDLFDLQSGLLFVRSQPLANGDVIRLAMLQGKSPYFATIRIVGRERITVPAGTFPAIKLELTLQDITDSFTLAPQKRFKRATGWFSDDENRWFLKLQTAIFIGKVWMEMERAEATP